MRNSVWALCSPLAWESSECCCSSGSWAGSSAGLGEGTPRRWAWAVCLRPEWGRAPAPATDQDMVADMVELPAAVSSRAYSEDLAELSLATGFTTSSPAATVASHRAMPRHIQSPNLPHPRTRGATTSLAVMTMAAREPHGTIRAAPTLVVVTGAAAMAAAIGVGAVATGVGVVVETAEVGDLHPTQLLAATITADETAAVRLEPMRKDARPGRFRLPRSRCRSRIRAQPGRL